MRDAKGSVFIRSKGIDGLKGDKSDPAVYGVGDEDDPKHGNKVLAGEYRI